MDKIKNQPPVPEPVKNGTPKPPARAGNDKSVKDTPSKPVPKNFAEAIYASITETFANKNPTQMFCLNWPGTILDYDRLKWDSEQEVGGNMPENSLIRTSQILDLYVPPAPITQPDGTLVSSRYRQAIRQFAPVPSKELIHLQSIIRTRLQKTVTVNINGTEKQMRMVDFFSYLYKKWTDAKKIWANKQQEMMEYFKKKYQDYKDQWWNEYLIWYENNAEAYVQDINLAHEELISEFSMTEWEDAIAILDTADSSGLAEAKTLLKNTTFPVPHQEGMNYIPTTGIPYNWVQELKPSTQFIDLLADPEAQQSSLDNAITQLQQQVMAWMAIIPQVNDEEIKQTADAFNKAHQTYFDANTAILHQFSKNTVEAVKIFCDVMASRNKKLSEAEGKEKDDAIKEVNQLRQSLNKSEGKAPGNDVNWEEIKKIAEKVGEGNDNLIDKQQALIDAGRKLAGAALDFLQSDSNRTRFSWLQGYVKQLEYKLENLRTQQARHESASNTYYNYLKSPYKEADKDKNKNELNTFGLDSFPKKNSSPENYRWTEVTVTIDYNQLKANNSLNTYFSQAQWGVDLFLFSGGGTNEISGSEFAEDFMEEGCEISIGFLATKVLINRPWMKPEVFQHSGNYFRTVKKALAPDKQMTHEGLMGEANKNELFKLLNDYSFPAYPVALLLAKDVVIKVKLKESATSRARKQEKAVKSQGGGFLCFSISNTEASQSEDESMNSFFMAGQMIARAPAPQVLGYWVQFMPPDQSKVLNQDDVTQISAALGFVDKLGDVHNMPLAQKRTPVKPD